FRGWCGSLCQRINGPRSVERIGRVADLDLVAVVHGIPGPLLLLGRVHQRFHRFLRKLAALFPPNGRGLLVDLLQDAIIDPDEHARIGLGLLGLVDDADLTVAEALLAIDEQAHSLLVTLGTQSVALHGKATPTGVGPVWIDLAAFDEG